MKQTKKEYIEHLKGCIEQSKKEIETMTNALNNTQQGPIKYARTPKMKKFLKDRIAFEKKAIEYFIKEIQEILEGKREWMRFKS